MRDLSLDETKFGKQFGKYDETYKFVQKHVDRCTARQLLREISSTRFRRFGVLLKPLILIKNYKTQAPFPDDVVTVLRCVVELRQSSIPADRLSKEPERLFLKIVGEQGFDLPTVSAVFHFCHPTRFPIVDRNVEAACIVLKRRDRAEFRGLEAPRLPYAKLSGAMKLARYRAFITFVDHIKNLQREQHGGNPSYRFIDKALMVIGARELKRLASLQRRALPKKRQRPLP
jgi:hypothetical protein